MENTKNNFIDYNNKKDYNQNIDNLIPYIAIDERKTKFLKYSKSEDFFKLEYKRMEKAIFICSKSAILDYENGQNLGVNNDEKYLYYYEIYSNINFGIIKVNIIKTKRRNFNDRNNQSNIRYFVENT